MPASLTGIHHMTAIVDDPQVNVNFYTDLLGLRLVKRTVNFDDPFTYHLYFGDELGRPGTILTFFPWTMARHGTSGSGQISATALAIGPDSVAFWVERLRSYGIRFADPVVRFGQQVISFYDPAGLLLELVTQPDVIDCAGWAGSAIPIEHTIRGIAGVALTLAHQERTARLLTDVLGFRYVASEDNRFRYATGDGGSGTLVDLVIRPDLSYGALGTGSVHHIAWRVADDEEQAAWQRILRQHSIDVTPVRDRQYFRSIYFREPGGVLFEIATDVPGFATDEPPEHLGTQLMLPPWLEAQRSDIERRLPQLKLPDLVLGGEER